MTKLLRTSIQLSLLKLAALIALMSWLVSCGSEDDFSATPNFQGPYIRAGIACGLCAGICQDTLIITPELLFYKGTEYTSGGQKTTIQNGAFTQAQWDDLLSSIDVGAYNALDLPESCNRCSDGCDRFYDIKTNEAYNFISVGWNDTIPSLGDFQAKVEEIRLSFQK